MKVVGISYLEAIRNLQQQGVQLARTVRILFTPGIAHAPCLTGVDEEVGGVGGMMQLVKDKARLAALNAAIALDEGIANPTDGYRVFYGERVPMQVVW
jgi:aminoacylase